MCVFHVFIKKNITIPEIISELDTLIGRWVSERHENEGFGDFTIRTGIIKPVVNAPVDFWDDSKVIIKSAA